MTGNPWFRVLQARPNAQHRLIIVPHAGGGPAYYRDWATRLPDGVEVVVAQLPGRASRWKEPPITRMEPLVQQLAPQLHSLLDRPVTLFGHSLGALVAFELARLWTEERRDVRGLIVSGAAGPQHPRTQTPLYSLTDSSLRDELKQLGGTPDEVQANDELFLLFLPTLRADLEVLDTYQYHTGPPLAIPMMVAGANADGWANLDQLLDWSAHTSANCDIRLYHGGHFFILDQRDRLLADVQRFLTLQKLAEAGTQLWRFDLDQPGDESVMSELERTRAARFLKPLIRERFVSSRTQLRRVLSGLLGVAPQDVALKTTDLGKPYLDPAVHASDCHFNLSHSENVGLLAIANGQEIGVDVEQVRPQIATGDLARRYFSTSEVAELESLPEHRRLRRFFDYWSAKEAYIKARGRGLNIPLDKFDVPIVDSPGPFTVVDRHDPAESGRWHVVPVQVNPQFAAALCAMNMTMPIAVNRL